MMEMSLMQVLAGALPGQPGKQAGGKGTGQQHPAFAGLLALLQQMQVSTPGELPQTVGNGTAAMPAILQQLELPPEILLSLAKAMAGGMPVGFTGELPAGVTDEQTVDALPPAAGQLNAAQLPQGENIPVEAAAAAAAGNATINTATNTTEKKGHTAENQVQTTDTAAAVSKPQGMPVEPPRGEKAGAAEATTGQGIPSFTAAAENAAHKRRGTLPEEKNRPVEPPGQSARDGTQFPARAALQTPAAQFGKPE
ncbi:MAG: hypothetical protein SCM57_09575, partial [Bacillota bacterium]|nr:hypothetical protein [Bacillota bacterium]